MIIIHNHYEYLQRKTVMSIKKRYFIVQLVLKFRKFGIKKERITELDEMKNMKIIILKLFLKNHYIFQEDIY